MMAYYGGLQTSSQEEGMAKMGNWKAWVEGFGDKVINAGTPLPDSRIVTATSVKDDDDPNAMKGFARVQAESMDQAVENAQSDPYLENSGTIRVFQMMEMP